MRPPRKYDPLPLPQGEWDLNLNATSNNLRTLGHVIASWAYLCIAADGTVVDASGWEVAPSLEAIGEALAGWGSYGWTALGSRPRLAGTDWTHRDPWLEPEEVAEWLRDHYDIASPPLNLGTGHPTSDAQQEQPLPWVTVVLLLLAPAPQKFPQAPVDALPASAEPAPEPLPPAPSPPLSPWRPRPPGAIRRLLRAAWRAPRGDAR